MKKRSFLLTAVLLVLAVALPFACLGRTRAFAEDAATEISGYDGYVFSLQVKDTFKEVDLDKIIATAGADNKEVYKNGEYVDNDYFYSVKITKSSGDLTVKYAANFTSGDVISLKLANDDGTITANYNVNKKSFDELKPNFKYSFTAESLAEYKEGISTTLKSGDTFSVPTLKEIVGLAGIDYSDVQRTVYYAYSGTSYTSTTSSTFTLSGVGEYRFYVAFKCDAFDLKGDNVLQITADGLYESIDGFYAATDASGKLLYAERHGSAGEYEYYERNDKGEKDADKPVDEANVTIGTECIIPVFTFDVAALDKPTVTIDSTYQEKGFIGQEYTVSSITVKNAETVKYTLVYSETLDGEYKEASETLTDNSKFTPEKTGYYKIRVYAMSDNGGEETKDTAAIEVKKAFETVKYKVGFKDWLSVNKLPFVFLCISAACLVGIVLLLVINPKPKDKKVKEEDK